MFLTKLSAFQTNSTLYTGNDCLINVWNSDNHDLLHSIKMADKAGGTTCLALTHDDRCAAGSAGTKAGVWDLDTGEAICRVDNEDVVTCLALTDDAKTMVTGSKNHVIKVWDISTGELKHALSGHEGRRCKELHMGSFQGASIFTNKI